MIHPSSTAKAAWEAYPEAASYSIDLFQYSGKINHLTAQTTKANSYKLEKPLPDGPYHLRVEAFNASGVKLAQAGKGIEFNIKNSQ